jgi:prephenate dehydratase
MSADNMPPLPTLLQRADQMYGTENLGNAVRIYARAYAAEQVRELVEALTEIASTKSLGDSTTALDFVREHAREAIAKHKGAA